MCKIYLHKTKQNEILCKVYMRKLMKNIKMCKVEERERKITNDFWSNSSVLTVC